MFYYAEHVDVFFVTLMEQTAEQGYKGSISPANILIRPIKTGLFQEIWENKVPFKKENDYRRQ